MHQTEMKLVIVTQAFIMINWSGFAVPQKNWKKLCLIQH